MKTHEIYDQLAGLAHDIVIDVMMEGEDKYPNTERAAIINKSDHIEHALAHLQAALIGDTSEDHLEHALTRITLELARIEDTRNV